MRTHDGARAKLYYVHLKPSRAPTVTQTAHDELFLAGELPMRFSFKDDTLFVGQIDGQLARFESSGAPAGAHWPAHTHMILAIEHSDDGRMITASYDGSIAVWREPTPRQFKRLARDIGGFSVAIRRGRMVVTRGDRVSWLEHTGQELCSPRVPGAGAAAVGDRLVAIAARNRVVFVDERCHLDNELQLPIDAGIVWVGFSARDSLLVLDDRHTMWRRDAQGDPWPWLTEVATAWSSPLDERVLVTKSKQLWLFDAAKHGRVLGVDVANRPFAMHSRGVVLADDAPGLQLLSTAGSPELSCPNLTPPATMFSLWPTPSTVRMSSRGDAAVVSLTSGGLLVCDTASATTLFAQRIGRAQWVYDAAFADEDATGVLALVKNSSGTSDLWRIDLSVETALRDLCILAGAHGKGDGASAIGTVCVEPRPGAKSAP